MSDALRAQILETAARLFFGQGFSQTGINQLITESKVARRTFYRYFDSKDSLGAAYLELAATRWLGQLRAASEGRASATATLKALFDTLHTFAQDTQFRGCGMLNMTAEFADPSARVRQDVRRYKAAQQHLIRELLGKHDVPGEISDQVHVLFEGAIAAAAAHTELWPIQAAHRASRALLHRERARRR